jgi:hypothetical protein
MAQCPSPTQDKRLTRNQIKVIAAAIPGDMLEFFDYFVIGFVLAFIIKPWNLTFGQSANLFLETHYSFRADHISFTLTIEAILSPYARP